MDRRALPLVLAALLLSVVLAEGIARIAGLHPREIRVNRFFQDNASSTWASPDAELGWINKPGVSQSLEEGHAPMTFWDFSRRASRPDPAPRGRLPVMVVGGSNAQSYGVRD